MHTSSGVYSYSRVCDEICPHHMCNCVKSAALVAIDETNIVAVDLTNVCESHDSVVLCSLVTGHMHIIKDLAGGCRSSRR